MTPCSITRTVGGGVLAIAVSLSGCARGTTTVQTHTRSEVVAPVPSPVAAERTTPVVVEERTTTTRAVRADDEPRGVLSTAVHVVGEIIALPFRLVGALLRALF